MINCQHVLYPQESHQKALDARPESPVVPKPSETCSSGTITFTNVSLASKSIVVDSQMFDHDDEVRIKLVVTFFVN